MHLRSKESTKDEWKENFRFFKRINLVWCGRIFSRNTDRYILCTAWLWKSNGSDSARSSDRRTYDVCGRNDRSERAQKCHGNCKNELWREGKPSFCRIKCITACWMDCDHDLWWRTCGRRRFTYRKLGVGSHHWCFDHCVDFYWTDQSWQIKYGCHDSTFYFITGTF